MLDFEGYPHVETYDEANTFGGEDAAKLKDVVSSLTNAIARLGAVSHSEAEDAAGRLEEVLGDLNKALDQAQEAASAEGYDPLREHGLTFRDVL